jgi:hypothetical protein
MLSFGIMGNLQVSVSKAKPVGFRSLVLNKHNLKLVNGFDVRPRLLSVQQSRVPELFLIFNCRLRFANEFPQLLRIQNIMRHLFTNILDRLRSCVPSRRRCCARS